MANGWRNARFPCVPTLYVPGGAIGFKQEREKRAEWTAQACVAQSARFSISYLKPIAPPGTVLPNGGTGMGALLHPFAMPYLPIYSM